MEIIVHGLHTTAWVFDTSDYTAIKVVDQYRDAEHALAGALRVLKGLMEGVLDTYTIDFLNNDVIIDNQLIRGICVTIEDCPIGAFVPQADLQDPFQIVVDKDEHFSRF